MEKKRYYIKGSSIQEIRKRQGFTMKELAKKCNYTVSYISQIESEKVKVSEETLAYIFDKIKVDLDQLRYSVDSYMFIINEFCFNLIQLDFIKADNIYNKICKFSKDMCLCFLDKQLNMCKAIYYSYHQDLNKCQLIFTKIDKINLEDEIDRMYILFKGYHYLQTCNYKDCLSCITLAGKYIQINERGLYNFLLSYYYIEINNFLKIEQTIELAQMEFLESNSFIGLMRVKLLYAYSLNRCGNYNESVDFCNRLLTIEHDENIQVELINLKSWILLKLGKYELALLLIKSINKGNRDTKFICNLLNVIYKKTYDNNEFFDSIKAIMHANDPEKLEKYYWKNQKKLNNDIKMWLIDLLINSYRNKGKYKHLVSLLEEKLILIYNKDDLS